jgi:large repetitive protein
MKLNKKKIIMNIKLLLILLLGLVTLATSQLVAQNHTNFVTYGYDANPNEGDNDFKQIFFIKMDEGTEDSVLIELFDADCSGDNDQSFNLKYNSEFKYSLYGGESAYTAKSITLEYPNRKDLYSGNKLKELITSNEIDYDNKWIPFTHINKNDGEYFEGSYYFKLLVEGITGDDANVFNVRTVSSTPGKVSILNYAPTIHLLAKSPKIQLRFNSETNSRIFVENYDADGIPVSLITPYRKAIELTSSGDGEWKSDVVELKEFEENEICAIQFGPGKKINNDAIFMIHDGYKKPIPIVLPITNIVENNRPVIVKKIIRTADCNRVILDATESNDNSADEITVKWVLPDGTIKYGFKEEITFPEAGDYPVILAIKDNSNAVESGSYQKFNVVINNSPQAVVGDDVFRATDDPITFDGGRSRDYDGWIKTYDWNYGDGTYASGKVTTHKYKEPGYYKVTLVVTDNSYGPCNMDSTSLNVLINHRPNAKAGKNISCSINEVIEFDGRNSNDPDGQIISYQWFFGDGEKGSNKKNIHSYSKAGKYTVTLTVTDDSKLKNNSSTDKITVFVNNPPVAKAGKDIEVAIGKEVVLDASNSFDNDGELNEYVWSAENLFIDTAKISKQSFDSAGIYKIKLKVKDNSGTRSHYDEDFVVITVNAPPIAKAGEDIYQTNAVVEFDGSKSFDSDGSITKYLWDFGDGTSSSMKTTSHIYRNPGEYKATLTVYDNSGVSNNSASDNINVKINAKPIADAGPDQLVASGENVTISANNSIDTDGSINFVEWRLGSELLSEENEFSHVLNEPGLYSIKLMVKDNSTHPDAIDYDNLIVRVNEAPYIITKNYFKITLDESIKFDASNSYDNDGSIKTFEWKLNNEVISNSEIFTNKFNKSGRYKITLSISDDSNVDNSTSQDNIDVFVNSSPVIKPIDDILSCDNLISFSASETYDAENDKLGFTWNYGDGTIAHGMQVKHKYNGPGVYPVLLTVDDGNSLPNSISTSQIKVRINSIPIAVAGDDEIMCSGDIITLDGSQSSDADGDLLKYEWDFGDSTTAEGITVNKNYNTPGLFTIKLKVSDNSGLSCNSSYDTKVIKVVESPVAFAGKDFIGCANKEVFFDAYKSTDSDGIVNSFVWDFGDGFTGGGVKTSHIYKKPGVYNVGLTITGELVGDCDNTATDELIVTIDEAPLAEFSRKDSVALNEEVMFNASESDGNGNNITNFSWNFGDGNIDYGESVTHTYSKSGTYIVELSIDTDSKAECSSTSIKKTVYVNDAPIAVAGNDLLSNKNQMLQFDASKSYDPNGKITKYKWNFADGTVKEGINVFHSFKTAGKYDVVLTITDETNLSNNSAIDELQVDVNDPPTGEINIPKYSFVGKSVLIEVENLNDVDGNIKSVVWSIGDGEYVDSASTSFEYVFENHGKYDILCKITDDKNAVTEISKTILIYQIPKLTIIGMNTFCADETIKYETIVTSDNTQINMPVEWQLQNGKVLPGNNTRSHIKKGGKQKLVVVLRNPNNKSDILLKKEIDVFVNQAPIARVSNDDNLFINGANDKIIFDASKSFDPDGDPLTYKWDLGDGNNMEGVKISHSYSKAGSYKVKLTVSDNRNCECSESTVTMTVKINSH